MGVLYEIYTQFSTSRSLRFSRILITFKLLFHSEKTEDTKVNIVYLIMNGKCEAKKAQSLADRIFDEIPAPKGLALCVLGDTEEVMFRLSKYTDPKDKRSAEIRELHRLRMIICCDLEINPLLETIVHESTPKLKEFFPELEVVDIQVWAIHMVLRELTHRLEATASNQPQARSA